MSTMDKRQCYNCGRYLSDKTEQRNYGGEPSGYIIEKNLRCSIGGFAIKKTATCDIWIAAGRGLVK